MVRAAVLAAVAARVAGAGMWSRYALSTRETAQVIAGIGYEIQSDSIGSGNNGLPAANTSVPNDLVPAEKTRFFTEMLSGFRYCRLALGLYFRGLTNDSRHIVERWPGQAAGLAEMAQVAGIEGFDVEYWSPAPAWKDSQAYINGALAGFNASFLSSFADAVVQDLQYLQANGMHVVQFGLQNEPPVGPEGCIYSCCGYTPDQYYDAFSFVGPAVREAFPGVTIHADSWGGQKHASAIAQNDTLRAYVDGWTWHCVGCDSNSQAGGGGYGDDAYGIPVWNNEFEYLSGISDFNYTFVNTAQSIMNWFAFVNSPTWFWLHALKPTYNSESLGYGLGFWRPWDDNNFNASHFPDLPYGHFQYNDVNWNAVAGFAKYMPWDSTRVVVNESTIMMDARILAFLFDPAKAAWLQGHPRLDAAVAAGSQLLGIVLSNRHNVSFTFAIDLPSFAGASPLPTFDGFQYTLAAANVSLGQQTATVNSTTGLPQATFTLQPNCLQFWLQAL